jgi:hypothetical protein
MQLDPTLLASSAFAALCGAAFLARSAVVKKSGSKPAAPVRPPGIWESAAYLSLPEGDPSNDKGLRAVGL